MNVLEKRRADNAKRAAAGHRFAQGPLNTSGLDLVTRYYWAHAKQRTARVTASLSRLLVRSN